MSKQKNPNSYAKNKKAYHDYEILEDFEAGIVLNGDEVKSIKNCQANLTGSYLEITNEEAWTTGIHISPYKFAHTKVSQPVRKRKLLLSKKEIAKIQRAISQTGVTAIPLSLYGKKGLIKIKIGLCKGKKLFDKRSDMKKKSQELDIKRAIKNY